MAAISASRAPVAFAVGARKDDTRRRRHTLLAVAQIRHDACLARRSPPPRARPWRDALATPGHCPSGAPALRDFPDTRRGTRHATRDRDLPVPAQGEHRIQRGRPAAASPRQQDTRRLDMAKYLVGWLLGVPVVVLVILYFFFH
jgi:hypothetical protein